jgi:hypothetical protein
VPHLSGTDLVAGFDPAAGDTLDLSALLAEAGVNIDSAIAQLGNSVTVTDVGGAAAISFDPTGLGGGGQVALPPRDGGLVGQLGMSRDFVAQSAIV